MASKFPKSNPNPKKNPWDMTEKFWSCGETAVFQTWILPVKTQSRDLWALTPECWWQILWVQWVARLGLHGLKLLRHVRMNWDPGNLEAGWGTRCHRGVWVPWGGGFCLVFKDDWGSQTSTWTSGSQVSQQNSVVRWSMLVTSTVAGLNA